MAGGKTAELHAFVLLLNPKTYEKYSYFFLGMTQALIRVGHISCLFVAKLFILCTDFKYIFKKWIGKWCASFTNEDDLKLFGVIGVREYK